MPRPPALPRRCRLFPRIRRHAQGRWCPSPQPGLCRHPAPDRRGRYAHLLLGRDRPRAGPHRARGAGQPRPDDRSRSRLLRVKIASPSAAPTALFSSAAWVRPAPAAWRWPRSWPSSTISTCLASAPDRRRCPCPGRSLEARLRRPRPLPRRSRLRPPAAAGPARPPLSYRPRPDDSPRRRHAQGHGWQPALARCACCPVPTSAASGPAPATSSWSTAMATSSR